MKAKLTMQDGQRLLTTKEKAAELRVCIRTLANYRKCGRVRFVKLTARTIRYAPEPELPEQGVAEPQ